MTLNPYIATVHCADAKKSETNSRFDCFSIGFLSLVHLAWHASVAISLGPALVSRNAFVHLVGLAGIAIGIGMCTRFRQSSKWILAFVGWTILAAYPPLCVFENSLNNTWRPYETFAFIVLIGQAILLLVVLTEHVSPQLSRRLLIEFFEQSFTRDSSLIADMAEPDDARESPS